MYMGVPQKADYPRIGQNIDVLRNKFIISSL